MIQKTPRQPMLSTTAPPTSGAITGATPPMIIITPNSFAAVLPDARSEMMALASTTPAAPAKPWTKRAPMRNSMLGASAAAMPATKQTAEPTMSGRRRPQLSDSGPITSWPSASPIRNVVRVSWMLLADVPSSVAIAGNPGRYISVARGGMAVSSARTAISTVPGGTVSRRSGAAAAFGEVSTCDMRARLTYKFICIRMVT